MPFLNLSRISFIFCICLLIIWTFKDRVKTKVFLRKFFLEPTSPVNLAIFRIITFYYVYLRARGQNPAYHLSIPAELRVPPPGYESWFHLIPLDLTFAQSAQSLLIVFSLLACLGFLTRLTSWLTLILSWYVFLLPIIFGKIDHGNHHMIWFIMILAVSPCHHALSFDALLTSLRKGTQKKTAPLTDHPMYTLPIRMIWILFAIIYFFPGFWKLWQTGWYWAFSDNLINQMHLNWQLRSIEPLFRVDRFPALTRLGSFIVMLFEIAAPLLILTPLTRIVFVITGLFFHKASEFFLGISFKALYCYYFVFIDWRYCLHLLAQIIYRRKTKVYCYASDPASYRVLSLCQAFNFFSMLEITPVDKKLSSEKENPAIFCSRKTWEDDHQASKILIYAPLVLWLWPLLKRRLLSLSEPDEAVGINSKACSILFIFVSAVLIISGMYCGFMSKNSWPFGQYPTFRYYTLPTRATLGIEAVLRNGSAQSFMTRDLNGLLPSSYLKPLENAILHKKDRKKAQGIIHILQKKRPKLSEAEIFRFYRLNIDLDPDRSGDGILSKDLLFEISPAPAEARS